METHSIVEVRLRIHNCVRMEQQETTWYMMMEQRNGRGVVYQSYETIQQVVKR